MGRQGGPRRLRRVVRLRVLVFRPVAVEGLPMTTEELRQKLMNRIDALLARTFMVYGEDRRLLSALRGYVAQMDASELEKVLVHLPTMRDTAVTQEPTTHAHHDHHAGHCGVIGCLAEAAATLKQQHSLCEAAGDQLGCACCDQCLALVLDAIDAQVRHLRGGCGH